MGTQQILLIVLSVIIVGVAIAVGISMFNAQAYNSNKTAVAADVQTFASQIVQYYKTPESQGGGSNALPTNTATRTALNNYLGWTAFATENENGKYAITAITPAGTPPTLEIVGIGKTSKGSNYPVATATITFPEGTIKTALTEGTDTSPTALGL